MALISKYWGGIDNYVETVAKDYSKDEIIQAYARGYITRKDMEEMLKAKGESDTRIVRPDKPVKPDKIFIQHEEQMLIKVQTLVKGELNDMYLSVGSPVVVEDSMFLTFELASVYTYRRIDNDMYYYEVYPETRGPVAIQKGFVVMHSPVLVKVADKEDVLDAARQVRTSAYGYPYPR